MAEESARLAALRDRLLAGMRAGIDRLTVNGSLEHRLPHNLHVSFADVDHASLVLGIARSVPFQMRMKPGQEGASPAADKTAARR